MFKNINHKETAIRIDHYSQIIFWSFGSITFFMLLACAAHMATKGAFIVHSFATWLYLILLFFYLGQKKYIQNQIKKFYGRAGGLWTLAWVLVGASYYFLKSYFDLGQNLSIGGMDTILATTIGSYCLSKVPHRMCPPSTSSLA